MGAPADHSDDLVKAVHPSSQGPRPRPGRCALGSRIGRGPIDCDPARPDRSERPQPAGRLINVNTASQAELEAHPRPDDGCRALVDRTLDGGGRDNITVVLASSTIPEVADTADRPARPR